MGLEKGEKCVATVFLLVLGISGSSWHPQIQLDTTLRVQGCVLVVVVGGLGDDTLLTRCGCGTRGENRKNLNLIHKL